MGILRPAAGHYLLYLHPDLTIEWARCGTAWRAGDPDED